MEITPNARRRALAVLGLSGSPTAGEIAAAYRRRVRDTHPDTSAAGDATTEFTAVVDAYRLLSGGPAGGAAVPLSTGRTVVPPLRHATRDGARGRPGSEIVAGPVRIAPIASRRRTNV